MKWTDFALLTLIAGVLFFGVVGCATLCKVPGVSSLPGVTCPTPAPAP